VCKNYADPSYYSELAETQKFDEDRGGALLFGGDECQKQLSVSVYIAYNAISLYG